MRNDETTTAYRTTERKSIWRWILPLLLLLLLGLGLLYYFTMKKDNPAVNDYVSSNRSDDIQTSQPRNDSDTLTDLSRLLGASQPETVIGKKVSLSTVTVMEVIGDKSFTIGTTDSHIYARLTEQLNSGQTEQAVVIQEGETRSIQGTVVAVPADMTDLVDQLQLNQEQADELKRQGFYLSVTRTNVVNNASGGGGEMPTGAGTE